MKTTNEDVKIRWSDYEIEWNDMILPINPELYHEWSLSDNRKLFDYPELIVPVRIMYVPDEEFDRVHRKDIEPTRPSYRKFWKIPKFWWQYHQTRAISYLGRIYIKESAAGDRALLLHELGHTIPFLEHTHMLRPGIMNPTRFMWLVKTRHVR